MEMHARWATTSGVRSRWAPAALLAVLVLGAWLRWTPREAAADLRPWPDALEYEATAQSLLEGRGYLLWIGDAAFPPRYPPGLPLLIASATPVVGTEPGSGVRVVLACALVAIAGTYALAHAAAGPAAGVVAALVVATSPLHAFWSTAVMSDVPASAAAAWLAAWLLSIVRRPAGALEHVALGVACGLAVWIRQPLVAFAAAACAGVGLLSAGTPSARVRRVLQVGLGVALAIAPLLWLAWELYGHPLRTGYGYWAPNTGFSARALVTAQKAERAPNLVVYARYLLGGRGHLYAWPAAALLAVGTLAGIRLGGRARSLAVLAWLATFVTLAMLAPYAVRTSRLLLPLLPLLAATMGLACAARAPRAVRGLGVALVAAALVVLAVHAERPNDAPHAGGGDVATLERIAAATEPDAAVLAHTNPFAFARVLRRDADRVWVPLQLDEHQAAIRLRRAKPVTRDASGTSWIERPVLWASERGGAVPRVAALCRSGRPVYLSARPSPTPGFVASVERLLRERFGLTEVAAEPHAVYRVACPEDAARRRSPEAARPVAQ